MIQYKNIVYCTDHSEDARLALVYAADLAARYGATLHVLHTLPSLHRYMPSEVLDQSTPGGVTAGDEAAKGKALDELKEKCGGQLGEVARVEYQIAVDTPFVEILRYAKDCGADLIILGASGRSELEPTHYGSTVDQVSRRAHCPVMAIRNPEKTYTL